MVVRLRKEVSLLDVYAAVACARAVLPLVEDMVAGRTAELPARREEIDRLEHEADRLVRAYGTFVRARGQHAGAGDELEPPIR